MFARQFSLFSGIIEADTDTDVIMVQTSTIPEDTSELSSITPGAISVEFNFAEVCFHAWTHNVYVCMYVYVYDLHMKWRII